MITRLPAIHGRAAFALMALASPAGLCAQEIEGQIAPDATIGNSDGIQDEVTISSASAAGASGRVAINIAAGNFNQQLGDALVVVGETAIGSQAASQHMGAYAASDRATSITIEEGAFAGIEGLTSINITAGTNNQMANLALLAIGENGVLTDQLLEQSRAPIQPDGGNPENQLSANDQIAVGNSAFGEGSGLLQINLIGGEGNSSANTFAISVLGEGSP